MKSFILALASSLAIANAASTCPSRRADFCGLWDTNNAGNYVVSNNLWGASQGSGYQCTGVDSLNNNVLAWHTSWSWDGASNQVKSYANVGYQLTPTQLSSISSIKTEWEWEYSGSDLVVDVSYDMFLSSSASGQDEYEIMIWLSTLGGANPITSSGSPIATTPTFAGVSWELYSGYNGNTKVYSFVAPSQQTKFSGDILEFLHYLESHEGVSSSQYLLRIQAGTEPFRGSNAKLVTSAYSMNIV